MKAATCHTDKPLLYKGLCAQCYRAQRKEKQRVASRSWYLKNKKHHQDLHRAWKANNADKYKATEKAWRDKNKEQLSKRNAEKYKKDKARRIAKSRAWYRANSTKALATQKQWREKNKSIVQALREAYRCRKTGAAGEASAEQIKQRFAFFFNRCAYCGSPGKLTIDHVIPISRGGSNWPSNLRPACRACNFSKHDRTLSEWKNSCALNSLERFNKDALGRVKQKEN